MSPQIAAFGYFLLGLLTIALAIYGAAYAFTGAAA